MSFLEVRHVQKIYTTRFGGTKVQALSDVNFTVEKGEYVAIMGESGSGKTTLLNILAALDKPTGGEVVLDGRALGTIPEREIAAFRRSQLGFAHFALIHVHIHLAIGQIHRHLIDACQFAHAFFDGFHTVLARHALYFEAGVFH